MALLWLLLAATLCGWPAAAAGGGDPAAAGMGCMMRADLLCAYCLLLTVCHNLCDRLDRRLNSWLVKSGHRSSENAARTLRHVESAKIFKSAVHGGSTQWQWGVGLWLAVGRPR